MKFFFFTLLGVTFGPKGALSAINIDGKHASAPALVGDGSPAPISDPIPFNPDRHDCPIPCKDYANMHSWTTYTTRERLNRCKEPMLVQLSLLQPVDVPAGSLIRACTLGSSSSSFAAAAKADAEAGAVKAPNPKTESKQYYHGSSLAIAPACAVPGREITAKLQLLNVPGPALSTATDITSLLQQAKAFFHTKDNCNENAIFALHRNVTLGIYIASGLGKGTVAPNVDAFMAKLKSSATSLSSQMSAELCDRKRKTETIFGITVGTTGDLKATQRTVMTWFQGKCARSTKLHQSSGTLGNTLVLDIAGVAGNGTQSNSTMASRIASRLDSMNLLSRSKANANEKLVARDTCKHTTVAKGDSCYSLASKCGISEAAIEHYNSYKSNFCTTLQPGQEVCCSSGDPYAPNKPRPNSDGTCASHLIKAGETCSSLAIQYGLTEEMIEKFNKGKTWAWTECSKMLSGYNLCLSPGYPPLPPAQDGTQCGPLVPGTKTPTDRSISMADLNPCPLKACCSNWGFCGVFPAHCDVHQQKGGGPGAKDPEFQNSCISNCGNEIKKNSDAPSSFQRIGYYEAFNIDRDCLLLHAKDANTDGSYTHIHYAFGSIDDKAWKPVVNTSTGQWEQFKALSGVKRILSLGGWAYSTEPGTFNIIRQAIINNRDTFADNLVKFVKDEEIDGIDIDWEYPGAPDIYVDGKPIGEKGDGLAYLKFLMTLKKKMGDKSVSIAAPASYWYLQAFPIERIAKVIDYIVYMTYDLHGQWDYGNVNAFDMCPSGKCIRSHVNLTETKNSLSMITKAGVPNNKIFVGEASYGRSFHMAQDGCWGPTCDFTGSRTHSDAQPGRCTKTGGYLGNAEINEIILKGEDVKIFHDGKSNTDVMLYNGDYVSYMTETTKSTRRADWRDLNFAGSIDWAVDLQGFSKADIEKLPVLPKPGEIGCIRGTGILDDSGELCEMTCHFGYCPESACVCEKYGPVNKLPPASSNRAFAKDPFDDEINRLCYFVCKYGSCPTNVCEWDMVNDDGLSVVPDDEYGLPQFNGKCVVSSDPKFRYLAIEPCKGWCKDIIQQAKDEGRTTNYGCSAFTPMGEEPEVVEVPGMKKGSGFLGTCMCDNPLANIIVDSVAEAMAIIGQIGCLIIMSTVKLVVKLGLALFPEVGRPIDAALDAVTSAAQIINDVYPKDQDPQAAFDFWLSPCGNLDLVPEELRKAFDILNQVSDSFGSLKTPKGKRGTGKKGDSTNPRGVVKPPPGKGNGNGKPGSNNGGNNGGQRQNSHTCRPGKDLGHFKQNHNTFDHVSCDRQSRKVTDRYVVTSINYANAKSSMTWKTTCEAKWDQACYHYSSVIRNNPKWDKLKCVRTAGTVKKGRDGGPATRIWGNEHKDYSWIGAPKQGIRALCDRDEYPPAYFFEKSDPDYKDGGKRGDAQLVRFLPSGDNQGAGSMWKGICLKGPLGLMKENDVTSAIKAAGGKNVATRTFGNHVVTHTQASVRVSHWPYFQIVKWQQPAAANDGLNDNTVCWPKAKASDDPGFQLLNVDPYNANNPARPTWRYDKPYVKGSNGT